jgi:hypothetical protein
MKSNTPQWLGEVDGSNYLDAEGLQELVDRLPQVLERYEDWVSLEREPRTLRRPLCGQCG